jgi:hypothetical protein
MSTSDDQFFRGRITRRVDFAPDLWSIRVNSQPDVMDVTVALSP